METMIRINWRESVPAVSVQFIHPWGIYNAGEKAGFTGPIATSLVEAGVAIYPTHPVMADMVMAETHNPFAEAPTARTMTKEEELAFFGVDTSTKEDSEDEMKRKALKRPGKDKMVKGSQTK